MKERTFLYQDEPVHIRQEGKAIVVYARDFKATLTQLKLLLLATEGYSYDEIANSAYVSERTVKKHMHSLRKQNAHLGKYGLIDKIAVRAYELELLFPTTLFRLENMKNEKNW